MIKFPTEIIIEFEKIQKRFIWPSKPKIKNKTISSGFKDRGLKNLDINKKIASLQYSGIKRCYHDSFHEWKSPPLKLITNSFGDDLKFHSNLSFNKSYVRHFPCFHKNILLNWKHLSKDPETISGILSQNLWFNKHIVIDNSIVNFNKFPQKLSFL